MENPTQLKRIGGRMHNYLKRENEKRIEAAKDVLKSIIERKKG
jgi:hypothetical protein